MKIITVNLDCRGCKDAYIMFMKFGEKKKALQSLPARNKHVTFQYLYRVVFYTPTHTNSHGC